MTHRHALRGAVLGALLLAGLPSGPLGADAPKTQAVLVLGTKQALFGPKAYPAYCKANEGKDRKVLRAEMLARLQVLAEEGRPKLLEVLGKRKDVRPLWLVNGVLAHLTPEEIEEVRAHEDVLWTYPAGAVPTKPKKDKVSEVLKRRKTRRRFSARKKTIPWHIEKLNVPLVWSELGFAGEGVVVASFDQGINYRHKDIARNVWRNPDEKPNNRRDDDKNGYIDDIYGFDFTRLSPEVLDRSGRRHGALTSSCTVGDGTGGTVTGVAPRAQVMSLVASGGAWCAALAFQYALEEGADVINMSFSSPNLGNTRGLWRMLAEHASAAGLVLVSGAGNFQKQAQIPVQIRIPEGIPCVICIGGLDRELAVPDFVSLGPVTWSSVKFYEDFPMPAGLVKPDVCAFPGPGIVMINPNGKKGYLGEENTRRGNSLSAPQGAGVIALMLSANPGLTSWAVKRILEETARDLEPKGKDPRSGAGLIDAYAAVKRSRPSAAAPARTK